MRISTTVIGLAAVVATGWFSTALVSGQQRAGGPPAPASHQMSATGQGTMTKEQKIADAMSAAPDSIAGKATILDWPAKEGQAPAVLRPGTNGWNCLPDMPDSAGRDPMCLDQSWMKWIEAHLARKAPQITSIGIGYMIAPGGAMGSNSDPHAMGATPTNHWVHHPPHLMIAVPDLKSLAGISTDPNNGGPYVMWAGTAYAHIMAPIAAPMPMTMMK